MIKVLLFIRYLIRLCIFVGLFIPFFVIGVPGFVFLDLISSPSPSDWVAKSIVKDFFLLAKWGE